MHVCITTFVSTCMVEFVILISMTTMQFQSSGISISMSSHSFFPNYIISTWIWHRSTRLLTLTPKSLPSRGQWSSPKVTRSNHYPFFNNHMVKNFFNIGKLFTLCVCVCMYVSCFVRAGTYTHTQTLNSTLTLNDRLDFPNSWGFSYTPIPIVSISLPTPTFSSI